MVARDRDLVVRDRYMIPMDRDLVVRDTDNIHSICFIFILVNKEYEKNYIQT